MAATGNANKTTIYDIAARAKVSTTTVHKALHNQRGVSEEKRQEILSIAQELNYSRNPIAQSLARKELHIGIVAEVHNEEFGKEIIEGIQFALQQLSDYKIIGRFSRLENSLSRPRVLEDFQSMLDSGVDAIILFPTGPYQEYQNFNPILEERKIPVITINNEIPGLRCLCSIQQDGKILGRMAADLMNLCNPKSASAVFIGSKDVHAQRASAESFREELSKTGGHMCALYETQVENQIGYVLTDNLLNNYPEVNGIFVGVSQCLGVIRRLRELGVEDRFRLITVDTYPEVLSLLSSGVISATLNRRPYEMGQLAVQLLYQYFILGIIPPDRILVPPTIITPNTIPTLDRTLYPNFSFLPGSSRA